MGAGVGVSSREPGVGDFGSDEGGGEGLTTALTEGNITAAWLLSGITIELGKFGRAVFGLEAACCGAKSAEEALDFGKVDVRVRILPSDIAADDVLTKP